jgi:hypothetical protein
MFRFFVAVLALVLCGELSAEIILSEIMFNPTGNERYDEFIELYNLGNESVDLFGWLLSDGTKFNTILPFENTSVLKPNHYALILVPNYFANSLIYANDIPDETLLFTIDRSQFGAYGLKNTEGEPISIHLPDTTRVARYQYSPDNKDGFSEEKVELDKGDAANNWQNSIRHGGTPGFENSVTPKPFDLALKHFSFTPANPSIKDSILFSFQIQNVGRQSFTEAVVVLQDSINGEFFRLMDEAVQFEALAPNDSLDVGLEIHPLPAGEHVFIATFHLADDGFPENNTARAACRIVETYARKSVLLNEIMYDTDEKADEWIEIYNASSKSVNMQHWTLRDKKKTTVLTTENYVLQPGDYCLLSNVEIDLAQCHNLVFNLPELNNSGDELVLMDAAGVVIDSFVYDKTFGGARYVSMERVRFEEPSTDASNWESCTAEHGSTPGQPNSVCPKDYDAAIWGPLYFSPANPMAGEAVLISFQLENAGKKQIQNVTLNMAGRAISQAEFLMIDQTSVNRLAIGETKNINFNWPDVPPGIQIVKIHLELPGDMMSTNNAICDTVAVSYPAESLIVNEIMYSPAREECEWVELFNKNDYAIELMNWTISDSETTCRTALSHHPFQLHSHEFLILCSDSVFLQSDFSTGLLVKSFPSLNNAEDAIHLFDAGARLVERVPYSSEWGGATGRSLERINPQVPAHEPTNWTTCVENTGHTAGKSNSIYIKVPPPKTSLSVHPDPFSPDGDGYDDFVALSYAVPGTLAHINLKIYDIKGRLVRFLLNNEPSGAERTVYWDGMDDDGIKCRMGIYIVTFEALNESKMCIEQARKTVVLAGAL